VGTPAAPQQHGGGSTRLQWRAQQGSSLLADGGGQQWRACRAVGCRGRSRHLADNRSRVRRAMASARAQCWLSHCSLLLLSAHLLSPVPWSLHALLQQTEGQWAGEPR